MTLEMLKPVWRWNGYPNQFSENLGVEIRLIREADFQICFWTQLDVESWCMFFESFFFAFPCIISTSLETQIHNHAFKTHLRAKVVLKTTNNDFSMGCNTRTKYNSQST